MMSGFFSYFGPRKDPKQAAREAIVNLRQQLQVIEKKEAFLQTKIEEELKKAKANAVNNKAVATAALKRKKMNETELDRLAGTRLQLEMQVNTLESANLNAETMLAMKKGAAALKEIHGNLTIDKVDSTMADVHDQKALADEIAELISSPPAGTMEDDELLNELEELEQEELNNRLADADHVPVHLPSSPAGVKDKQPAVVEDDEAAQLRELQAALAM